MMCREKEVKIITNKYGAMCITDTYVRLGDFYWCISSRIEICECDPCDDRIKNSVRAMANESYSYLIAICFETLFSSNHGHVNSSKTIACPFRDQEGRDYQEKNYVSSLFSMEIIGFLPSKSIDARTHSIVLSMHSSSNTMQSRRKGIGKTYTKNDVNPHGLRIGEQKHDEKISIIDHPHGGGEGKHKYVNINKCSKCSAGWAAYLLKQIAA